MSIRTTLAIVAIATVGFTANVATSTTAEAGFKRDRAAKAAPAPRAHAGCPLRDMMKRVHTRLHDRAHARPMKVAKAASKAPKK